MDLNEFDCQLLDEVLAAFGKKDSLNRDELLEMFGGEEDYAAAMIGVLVSRGLVTEAGHAIGHTLPLIINREPKVALFLRNGGFTTQHGDLEKRKESDSQEDHLRQRNLQLLNEALEYQMTIRDRDEKIKSLELVNKRFELIKYLLWAAGLIISGLAFWIYRLFPPHY